MPAKIRSFKPKQHQSREPLAPVLNYQPSQAGKTLKVIPIGGLGDVQKNMYVYEYGNDIVILDCGIGFPDEAMLGVDLVIPDISYLKDKKSNIRGIVISHGHEDHIGALPFIWPELDVPIYSQKLTCGLIKAKFTEHNLPKDKIKTLGIDESVKLGVFDISFFRVNHSIPDSTGVVMRTPAGTVVHQPDFKMDWTPVNGQVTDIAKMAQIGNSGVLFMTVDCLGMERQGYNPSEHGIQAKFSEIEKQTKGKLLITTTSSNLTRIQQIINVSTESGRKLALSGRSIESNFQVARDLGYLQVSPGLVIAQEEIKRYPANKLVVLIAGAQGQPESALARATNHAHKFIKLDKDDAVVFSATPIPSSEAAQSALIDNLAKQGVNVHYTSINSELHVSGHASMEEIKLSVSLIKPKFILPIGGNFRHMRLFEKMAKSMGYDENQVVFAQDGDIIEVTRSFAKVNGHIDVFNVYVDGFGVGDVGNVVLRDRQTMAEEGIVVVIIPVSQHTGKFVGEPDIISRGFVFEKTSEDLLEAAKEIVKSCLSDQRKESGQVDWRYMRRNIEENLERYFYEETKRQPMILPVVVDL